jgi:hypothetical protein
MLCDVIIVTDHIIVMEGSFKLQNQFLVMVFNKWFMVLLPLVRSRTRLYS